MNSHVIKTFAIAAVVISSGFPLMAIEPGKSTARFTVDDQSVSGEGRFAWQTIDKVLEIDTNKDGTLEESELDSAQAFLNEYGETLFQVSTGGDESLVASSVASAFDAENGSITFYYHYDLEQPVVTDDVSVEFTGLPDFEAGHQGRILLVDSDSKTLADRLVGEGGARPLFPDPAPVAIQPGQKAQPLAAAISPPPADLPSILLAAGFLLIAFTVCFWFIQRIRLASKLGAS